MKKILAGILSVVLVLGLVIGGITWRNRNGSGGPVSVYYASDLSTTYWGDENESYGMVSTDRIQNIYLSDTQTVKEVMVEEGQEVKKGDVLMTYDTTLSEVELLKKDLSIQQMELDLQTAKKNLSKISTYRPGVPVSESNQVTASQEPSLTIPGTSLTIQGLNRSVAFFLTGELVSTEANETEEIPTETQPPTTEEAEQPTTTEPESTEPTSKETESETNRESESSETDPTKTPESSETESSTDDSGKTDPDVVYPKLIGGRGTDAVPYVFNWNSQWTFNQDLLAYLSQGRKDAYVMLKLNADEKEDASGSADSETDQAATGSWWKIEIKRDNLNEYTFEMISMCVHGMVVDVVPTDDSDDSGNSDNDMDPIDPYIPDYSGDIGMTYTAAEIAEMMSEAQDRVRDLDLDIRVAKVELERMEKELNNGAVYAEFDGIVKTVRDQETAKIDSQSLIDVSGGGGYYVSGSISELQLDEIYIGKTVNVMSWDSYMSYEGTIQSIAEYPSSDSYYSGSGNSNVSYYAFTVFIDESAELRDDEYVSLTYTSDDMEDGSHFYLQSSMIRSDNGRSYVYVANEEGKLEKREVRTGKNLWGSYTEIVNGISLDDQVAFPYGKAVKEGADTTPSTVDELYSYY